MASDLLYPGSVLSLHRKAADRLMAAGNGDAALLYLCRLTGRDGSALKWDSARLEQAHRALAELKLADPDQPPAAPPPKRPENDLPPDYSTQDITQALAATDFAALVPEVEKLLGKLLSPADLKTLYLLYDYLPLPREVILLLVQWCVEQSARRGGPGRKPTLPQIRREAYKWRNAGAVTLDAAEEYLRRQARLSSRGQEIMALLDRPGRSPVPQEAAYLDQWSQMGFDDGALRAAYDRTMFQVGQFRWSYMNGILLSWQRQGLYTLAAVEAAERRRKPAAAPRGEARPVVDTADIDRMFAEARRASQAPGDGKED